MTAFLRRATSGLLMWLGLDSASIRGFVLGRPGNGWQTWSLLVPVTAVGARRVPASPAPAIRVCR